MDEIFFELDTEHIVNKQYVETEKLCIDQSIQSEERRKKLIEILSYTMPDINKNFDIYRIPFRAEYEILNQIAITYREENNLTMALQIYKKLRQKFNQNNVSMKFHVIPGLSLYLNYAAFLEVNNNLDEAEMVSLEALKFVITTGRADIAGDVLVNCSCIYDKRKNFKKEEQYLRHGYKFMQLYDLKVITPVIEEEYLKK